MNTERLIEVVIIDDEAKREQTYEDFFAALRAYKQLDPTFMPGLAFQLAFCSTASAAKAEIAKPGVSICLRDVMLTPSWSSHDVAEVTERIAAKKLPLILVSAFFEKAALPELRGIVRRLNSFPPLLRWTDIEAAAQGKTASETFAIFEYFVNLLLHSDPLVALGENGAVSVLHITDLHFGKAAFLAGQAPAMKEAMRQLQTPSFLAITGDVADSGMPSEYAKALQMVKRFLEHELLGKVVEIPSRRIFMTPGNHDFCWGLAMAGSVVSKRGGRLGFLGRLGAWLRFSTSNVFDIDLGAANKRIEELGSFGLRPFSDFASQISWGLKANGGIPAYRYVADYSQSGLHIVELNVEAFKIPGTSRQLVDLESYKKSLDELLGDLKDVPQGHCILFLAHRSDLEDSSLWQKNFDNVLCPLSRQYAVILLSGHVHEFQQRLQGNDRSWLSISGSCLGDHTDVQRPTVLHIQLERADGRVVVVTVNVLEQEGNEWVAKPQMANSCEYSSGQPRWS
jgi:hypothetical protein